MTATSVDNPFRGRILAERIVASNKDFKIVEDSDPVVPGHLLIFSVEEAASFADCPTESLCTFLEGEFSDQFTAQKYLFVERGRGRFCSSFGNIIHAHGHLVPKDSWDRTSIAGVNAKKASCLREAFQLIKGADEYLLVGQVGGGFDVVCPLINAPKRLARMIVNGDSLSRRVPSTQVQ